VRWGDSTTVFRDEIVEDRPWSDLEQDGMSRLLAEQRGVISTRQAMRYMSEKAIRHKVTSGRWRVAYRGVFLTHTGRLTQGEHLWVAVLAAGCGRPALLGGATALIAHGLRGVREDAVHVVVPHARRPTVPKGVRLHRVASLTTDDVDRWVKPPCTVVGRSVVDAAQWARSDEQARLMIATAFQQRMLHLADIERVLEQLPNPNRRRLILETARDCQEGAHSLSELEFARLCRRAGLPLPSRQFRWRDRTGRRRYVDAVFDEWKIAVEIDGVQHLDVGVAWDDARRQNDLELAGYLVLRYPAWVVRSHPERVIDDLRRALINAGWRPGRGSG
jgi:very-short-patch-repair endonuclease